ncbi:rod shape-determining protein MreC [Sedimentibacter sp. zth1]|uniref:rod shape-determining protein MreC n=1 Tax=Sedimentibacter sp. zth1 TaxID=2816908 RepID=UPI001A90D5D4|nr:rod shape-determining protein MreC [Sedimentibacter sp. zth1]QSX06209.1 rod shape-determining protein MreC [Sedimentibacter sp. zth1]
MKISQRSIKKFVIVLVILGLIILIGITANPNKDINSAENAVGSSVSFLQKTVYNIGQTVKNAFKSVQDISKINKENEVLKEMLYKLKEDNRILKNIVNTSNVLEAEYKLRNSLKYDYVVGQVIAKDDSNWFSRFTIDQGRDDGVKKNDIVIQAIETEEGIVQIGLVGVISEVGHNFAKVITIIDENCKVSFKNIENNESGIITGNTDGKISGYFLDNKATANVGDELFTSGIGNVYLKDIFIGKISKVIDTTDASSKKIYVKPIIEFKNIYKVFVLKIDR